jgi:anti-sigma regulatory factor (Ser/Thr protein kinase)
VRRFLAPLALTEEARQDLVLAVSEAATNAVAHAYTTYRLPRGTPWN